MIQSRILVASRNARSIMILSMTSDSKHCLHKQISSNVYGNSRQWYEQLHRNFYNSGRSEDESSVSRNNENEARTPLRIGWKWPFGQQSPMKVTGHPPSNTQENAYDMLQNDKFLYPDSEVEPQGIKIEAPPTCKGNTFCEDVSNYPMELLKDLIENSQSVKHYENVDKDRIVYPRSAESVDKEWLYVVNYPNFTQGIQIQTCNNMGGKCNLINGFAEGYITSCEQKYTYRHLTAIASNGTITREHFRFPSSCCCHIQFAPTLRRYRTNKSTSSQNTQNDVHANN